MRAKNSTQFLKLYNLSLGQILGAILVFTLALLAYRFQVFLNLNTHLFGGVSIDAGLYYYLFNYHRTKLFSNWFDAPFYYPYSGSISWSDNFILPALITWPLDWFGLGLALQYNSALLGALLLNGFCSFLLAYRISGLFWNSIYTGLIVFFLAFIGENSGHPQLLFIFWIPLGLVYILNYIANGTLKAALQIHFIIFLCLLTSVYYSVFLALLLCFIVFSVSIQKPAWLSKKKIVNLFLPSLLILPASLPILFPYLASKELFGARRLYESFFLSANYESYFTSAATSLVYSWLSNTNNIEAGLFSGLILAATMLYAIWRVINIRGLLLPGVICILSFAVALILASHKDYILRSVSATLLWTTLFLLFYCYRQIGKKERLANYFSLSNRNLIAIFLGVILFFSILALGPLANSDWRETAFSPFVFLYYTFPGFSSLRSAYRLAFVSVLFMALLTIFIFPLFYKYKFAQKIKLPLLLSLLIIIENWQITFPLEELPNHKITSDRAHSVSLVLPLQDYSKSVSQVDPLSYARYNVDAMLWSLPNTTIINGYSGQIPRLHARLIEQLRFFPNSQTIEHLTSFLGLKTILYEGNKTINFDEIAFETNLNFIKQLSLLQKNGTSYLLEFNPETEIVTTRTFFVPARPDLTLELEIKLTNPIKECELQLYTVSKETKTLLTKLNIMEDKSYRWHQISLAKTRPAQKALTILIENTCSTSVFLRGSKLVSTQTY